MSKTEEISKGLIELSCSSIKADQTAVRRLENGLGMGVDSIIDHLDTVRYLEQSFVDRQERQIPTKRPTQPGRIIACGLVGASLSGIIFLAANSGSVPVAISLGFTGGAALAKVSEY